MLSGLLFGILIGLVCILLVAMFFMMKDEDVKSSICLVAFVIGLLGSTIVGTIGNNYNIQKDIARYEAAYQTYTNSINGPGITEYERVAILQTTMSINQEIAASKVYVNSIWSIGVTQENKKAMNDIRLIGE